MLPRSLRKPARIIGRLLGGHVTPPRYAATMATAAFLSITGLYGTVVGGHVPTLVQAVTARSGFAIDDVRMSGNKETSDIDILERLGLDGWTSLIGMDADAARKRISDLPWIESVSVRKIYPNTIEISVVERKPFAIWQHGRTLS
ncbi:MAG: FtsQ-type POTRA domain-containing protein, partial [Mesorhizobium sp.]|nr:FtsQ-type POTRA domain-containing protein [Mesorhizobium sp.]